MGHTLLKKAILLLKMANVRFDLNTAVNNVRSDQEKDSLSEQYWKIFSN